jgi:hypothetical protein
MRAVSRPTGNGENLIQGLHRFIPLEIITPYQKITAGGATEQLGMVDEALLSV